MAKGRSLTLMAGLALLALLACAGLVLLSRGVTDGGPAAARRPRPTPSSDSAAAKEGASARSLVVDDGALFASRDRLRALLVNRLISSQTIFVNVAAFRDLLCVESVREIFSAAAHPERIAVGVIDQRISGDRVCIPPEYLRYVPAPPTETTTAPSHLDPEYPSFPNRFVSCYKKGFCPSDSIRVRYVDQTEARGPTYGRFVAGLMYQGESFYMMIDSHSRFHPAFDTGMLLDMLRLRGTYSGETGAKGGVLSYYPAGFNKFSGPVNTKADIMAMCKSEYVKELSVLRNGARWVRQPKRPIIQPYTAAGFLFSDATAQLDVPFDPYLDFVFDGEEILYTVRLYTAGYDAYMPGGAHIYHHYDRHKAHRFWSVPGTQWGRIQGITRNRVHYFLQTYHNQTTRLIVDSAAAAASGVSVREELYGLGIVRPIEKFYEFARVDRQTWKVDQDIICGDMEKEANERNAAARAKAEAAAIAKHFLPGRNMLTLDHRRLRLKGNADNRVYVVKH